jgi:hypothetical protein
MTVRASATRKVERFGGPKGRRSAPGGLPNRLADCQLSGELRQIAGHFLTIPSPAQNVTEC